MLFNVGIEVSIIRDFCISTKAVLLEAKLTRLKAEAGWGMLLNRRLIAIVVRVIQS